MAGEPVVFRDVPGVADIERRLHDEQANRLMKPEIEQLAVDIDRMSLTLFGVTRGQTYYEAQPHADRPAYEEDWEQRFTFLDDIWEEELAYWEAAGLDMSDGEGEPLLCVDVFGRQIVCAVLGIHRSAALLFAQARSPRRIPRLQRRRGGASF